MAKAPKKTTSTTAKPKKETPVKEVKQKKEKPAKVTPAITETVEVVAPKPEVKKQNKNPNNEVPMAVAAQVLATFKKLHTPVLIGYDDKKLLSNIDKEIINDAIYTSDPEFETKLINMVKEWEEKKNKFSIVIYDQKITAPSAILNKFATIKLVE